MLATKLRWKSKCIPNSALLLKRLLNAYSYKQEERGGGVGTPLAIKRRIVNNAEIQENMQQEIQLWACILAKNFGGEKFKDIGAIALSEIRKQREEQRLALQGGAPWTPRHA